MVCLLLCIGFYFVFCGVLCIYFILATVPELCDLVRSLCSRSVFVCIFYKLKICKSTCLLSVQQMKSNPGLVVLSAGHSV